MKVRLWLGLFFSVPMFFVLSAQRADIKSPDQFLPYPLGSRFTPHHLLVDYFRSIDAQSDKVQVIQYGETYEYRPLIAAIISSPANMQRLENIRLNNLLRASTNFSSAVQDSITIVYLSFSVHGNEAAGSESAMGVLYDLVKGGEPYDSWLKNTIVIIDPSLNPDGYERFTHYSNSVSNTPADPRHEVREHDEPWPGGRYNHYYTDLNRDWAWQSQQETRARIAFYQRWMPHVHADLHEMESEASYYFAPAAQPFHPYLTAWQAEFQKTIGQNHARHFDEKGWRYYTKERFDLFYPGYGDTYPSFSGAIGMTYEQGGSGYGNKAILLENGDTLTLYDRIAHHRAAALSTIEISSKNAGRLVSEFASFFQKSISDPPGPVNSYVVRKSNSPGKISDLTQLLKANGISFGLVKDERKALRGFSYTNNNSEIFTAQKGDLIIPASQPRSVLLQVLFEPEGKLSDSLTYDITAWSIPMAYGLEAFATEEKIEFIPLVDTARVQMNMQLHPVAYAIQWGSVSAARLLVDLMSKGIVTRYALKPFSVAGVSYDAGTILCMRSDNERNADFENTIKLKAAESVIPVSAVLTGFVDSGKDLGSSDYPLIRRPEVIALSGDDMSPSGLGEVWHFFEEELHYPIHIVNANQLEDINLQPYTIMVWNEGYFDVTDGLLEKVTDWISNGGHLITIGASVDRLSGKSGFSIERVKETEADSLKKLEAQTVPKSYGSGERDFITDDIAGAVFKTQMDKTNPLSFGLGKTYWTLKTRIASYAWLKEGQNAMYLDDAPQHYGFAGAKALDKTKKTLIAGAEQIGNGAVIYLVDNPLYRSFWNNGKVLFCNALFF